MKFGELYALHIQMRLQNTDNYLWIAFANNWRVAFSKLTIYISTVFTKRRVIDFCRVNTSACCL